MVHDVIQVSIDIAAPVERVFESIAEPSNWAQWFSDAVEGDFEVGSQPIIDEGKYGKFRIAIVGKEPPTYFAYRWVSGMAFVPQGFLGDPLEHPNTLVEFRLSENEAGGTTVQVTETGFASLPESYRDANFEDNTGGWSYQVPRLKLFVETGKAE